MSENKEQTLATLLGIDDMPEGQKEALLERVGNIIIDASVGNLLLTLNEEQVKKLDQYMSNVGEEDDIFAYLLRTYPDFQSIVEKEVAALQEEAEEIFG